jgi:hypothetical protein
MLTRKKSIRLRTGRTRRTGAEPIFIGPGLFGEYDGEGDAIAIVDIDGNPWRPRKRGVAEDSHGRDDEVSVDDEGDVGDSDDDETGNRLSGSPTGRLALRSSRKVDRLRSESRKIDLDEENDVLRRIRDAGDRCRKPKRYLLGVLVFPKGADGWVRVVADHMVPTTSTGTPRERPPSPPVAQRGLKPPKRLRPRARDE